MSILFDLIGSSIRVPGVRIETHAVPKTGAGTFVSLLIGQGGGVSARGPDLIQSAAQAKGLYVAGSQLARMCEAYKRNNPGGKLYAICVADPTGTAAYADLICEDPSISADGVMSLYVGDQLVQVELTTTMTTPAAVLAAIKTAVNAVADLPVTANNPTAFAWSTTLTTPTGTLAWLHTRINTGKLTVQPSTTPGEGSDYTALVTGIDHATGLSGTETLTFTHAGAGAAQETSKSWDEITSVAFAGAGGQTTWTVSGSDPGTTTMRLTAKWDGLSGNGILIHLDWKGAEGGEETPSGHGIYTLVDDGVPQDLVTANGTGAVDLTAAITAMGQTRYDFIGLPTRDADLQAEILRRWGYNVMLYGHAWAGAVGNLATLQGLGAAAGNDPHLSLVGWDELAPTPWYEMVAAYMGQAAGSLAADWNRPLQTLELLGVTPAKAPFDADDREVLLGSGIATTMPLTGGKCAIERSITTYTQDAWGNEDISQLDVEIVHTAAQISRDTKAALQAAFPRHKLVSDGTLFSSGVAAVTPSMIKAVLIGRYKALERLAIVENVTAFLSTLQVERSETDPERVDFVESPDIGNGLRIIAGRNDFRVQY